MQTTHDLMRRLKQEACLEGHLGCVNCLEWNQRGDLLASGSDDCNIIIWDIFKQRKKCLVQTGHRKNIFSVKFMPASNDSQVVSCGGDGQIRLTNALNSANLLVCKTCHGERVKRLAVHPSEPNLIWSAGEKGLILQHDTRQAHVCSTSKPANLLIDLNTISKCVSAKCIAVNPVRSEMLAIGSNDIYNRLFDRRAPKSCIAYFAPGHLHKTNNRSNNLQSYGTTYLTFNSNGSELLASVHAEQVYLFNTYEPWQKCQSFNLPIRPTTELKPCAPPPDLKRRQCPVDYLNELLEKVSNSPDLYRARAKALTSRGWRGDYYQALRDCCCALALKPVDFETIRCLATTLIKLGDKKDASSLLEFVEGTIREFGNQMELLESKRMLVTFMRSPSPQQCGSLDNGRSGVKNILAASLLPTLNDEFAYLQDDCIFKKKFVKKEYEQSVKSFDFIRRYCGHCNMNTDIKEANFFGCKDEFIVGGSDDGAFYIWDKYTTNIVKAVHADYQILNCVQPHPTICMLATSGIEKNVKLWSTSGKVSRDVEALETRCSQNQKHISTDPLEAMYMMLYPSRALF